jgi:uncharacterized membrane protein YphA (DoxX/SURF4 family)
MQSRMSPITAYLNWLVSQGYRLPEKALGLYRIAFCLFLILIKGTPDITWLSGIPDLLYDPPAIGPAAMFEGFPPQWVSIPLTILTAIAAACVLFGYRTRISSLSLFGLLLVTSTLTYTFGKINHDELMAMVVPGLMAFSGWGNTFSIDAARGVRYPNRGWPVAMIAMVLAFAMFTAGVPKLLSGWLDPRTAAVQGHVVHRVYAVGINDYLVLPLLRVDLGLVWEIFDYFVVIFELAFLLAFLRPRLFRAWLVIAVGFHLANLLVLNISFTANLVVYLLFINWESILRAVERVHFRRVLSLFESGAMLTLVTVTSVGFVVWRAIEGGASENSLRSAINADVPAGIAAPINFILGAGPMSWLDINLALLISAGLVAGTQVLLLVRKYVAAGNLSD